MKAKNRNKKKDVEKKNGSFNKISAKQEVNEINMTGSLEEERWKTKTRKLVLLLRWLVVIEQTTERTEKKLFTTYALQLSFLGP